MNWYGKVVLVIDDEPQMCQLLDTIFRRAGATVQLAHNGSAGLQSVVEAPPDLVILDILMPDIDGIATLKELRLRTAVPVVMLTAVNESKMLIQSLDLGADAYVTKPFKKDELLASCQAVLRRTGGEGTAEPLLGYDDGTLAIDLEKRWVSVDGERTRLTATEYALLAYLFRNRDRVCLFENILTEVWGDSYGRGADKVHVFIWQLRQKIEPDPKNPRYLISEHSVGYRFMNQA